MAQAAAQGGAIDGLVANAGWANNVGGKAYDEITPDVWDRMMAINVRGTWLTVRAVAPVDARWRLDRHGVVGHDLLGRAEASCITSPASRRWSA